MGKELLSLNLLNKYTFSEEETRPSPRVAPLGAARAEPKRPAPPLLARRHPPSSSSEWLLVSRAAARKAAARPLLPPLHLPSPSPPPAALMGTPRATWWRRRDPVVRAWFYPGDGRIRAHGPQICSLGAAAGRRSGGLVLHGGGGMLRPAAPGCSWGGRIRASRARICPPGAVAGCRSPVTSGGGGAHLRPGGSSVTGTYGLADVGVLGDACGRRWVSVRGGGACFRSAGSGSALWMAEAVPWWPSCGHPKWRLRCLWLSPRRPRPVPVWVVCNDVLVVPWWHGRPRSPCANSCMWHHGGAHGGGRVVASVVFCRSATTMQVKTLSS
jgi:hypothetical protein